MADLKDRTDRDLLVSLSVSVEAILAEMTALKALVEAAPKRKAAPAAPAAPAASAAAPAEDEAPEAPEPAEPAKFPNNVMNYCAQYHDKIIKLVCEATVASAMQACKEANGKKNKPQGEGTEAFKRNLGREIHKAASADEKKAIAAAFQKDKAAHANPVSQVG